MVPLFFKAARLQAVYCTGGAFDLYGCHGTKVLVP